MKVHLLAITYLYYCCICVSIVSVSLSVVEKELGLGVCGALCLMITLEVSSTSFPYPALIFPLHSEFLLCHCLIVQKIYFCIDWTSYYYSIDNIVF